VSAGEPQGAGTVRVAVVDTHILIGHGLAALIAAPDLEVVATESSWDGLLAHPAMPVDVVVVDMHLFDGLLIGSRVRELAALGTSAVVLSRRADAAAVGAAILAGARAFVATSDTPSELTAAVRAAGRGAQHLAAHHAAAARASVAAPDPVLGRREERALVLYAAGRSAREVAGMMATTEETVKSYIKRARRKYRDLGVDVGSRPLLREHAARQGWTIPE
jgi:DNA-binding NarL/FixJ family response regulator